MLGSAKLLAIAAALAVLVSSDSGVAAGKPSKGGPSVFPDKFGLRQSFATKTSYWNQCSSDFVEEYTKFSMPKKRGKDAYSLMQSHFVVRHGTRYPTAGNTQEIMDLLAKLKKNYLFDVPAWLRTYELPYNLTVEGQLAEPGYAELKALGARARAEAQNLPFVFSSDKFNITHTHKSRTRESAKAFASAYFSNPGDVVLTENPKKKDMMLRFYDECKRYQREVKDKDIAGAMVAAYEATPGMLGLVKRFKDKLFIKGNVQADDITIKDVETAYSACSFDLALYDNNKQWCTLLDEIMIDRIEYAEDLETYYEEAHGSKINYEIASVLLKDIVSSMTDFINSKSRIVGNFRFAHGETTIPLMALLGYSDAVEMPSEPTDEQRNKRKFRTSVLGPFAANIEFRLYKSIENSQYYVMIRVNERATKIPGCGEVLCPLEKALKLWSYYLETYNFAQECA